MKHEDNVTYVTRLLLKRHAAGSFLKGARQRPLTPRRDRVAGDGRRTEAMDVIRLGRQVKFLTPQLIVLLALTLSTPALARYHHHGYTPWCGIYMRTQVYGDPGPSYNLARNWSHWGSRASGPAPGVIVVWPHHVGKVVYGECPAGAAMVNSGNDGNAIRTRCLPMRGVIAYRQ